MFLIIFIFRASQTDYCW